MEINELVSVIVDGGELHSEQTCPWHEKNSPANRTLQPADVEEDKAGIPSNDGGVLGRNLGHQPTGVTVQLSYAHTDSVLRQNKLVAEFSETSSAQSFDVVFSAHHVIPGNEALKGHGVLRWIGDDASLGEYKKDVASELAEGEFTGYDVNTADNGIWLPGPYSLSTQPGLGGAPSRWPDKKLASATSANFKQDFAFAVMDRCGRQFHYRHSEYSKFVRKLLSKLDTRLSSYVQQCPVINPPDSAPHKPYKAPPGMVAKLGRISARTRVLLDGSRWHPGVFTDESARRYMAVGGKRRLRSLGQ